jgi:hypothetical protein
MTISFSLPIWLIVTFKVAVEIVFAMACLGLAGIAGLFSIRGILKWRSIWWLCRVFATVWINKDSEGAEAWLENWGEYFLREWATKSPSRREKLRRFVANMDSQP